MANEVLVEVIAEIKSKLKEYITGPRGKTITSTGHFKCPITYNHKHGDNTPSCHIDMKDGVGVWFCHTCNTGGTIYDLLYHEEHMQIDGPGFLQATSYLAQKLGIFIDEDLIKDADYTQYSKEASTLVIYQDIENYLLEHGDPIGSLADADFGRGYNELQAKDIIKIVPLGSVDNTEMFDFLLAKYGDVFKETPVFKFNKPGTVFGKNTLTMSYRDQRGNPIRFIGRYRDSYRNNHLKDGMKISKYIQTVGLFGKIKEVPFLLDVAYDEIRRTKQVNITEGEYDAIAMHLMKFKNTVASRGVSITEKFIDILFHMKVKDVTLILDNDHAAIASIVKYYKYFSDSDMALYVLPVEQGYDPDRYVREGQCLEMENRIDAVEYVLKNYRDFSDPTIPETVRYHNCIAFLAENITMHAYQQKYSEDILSTSFGFHGDIIFADIKNYILGLETKDIRVKKIHDRVEGVKNSSVMERINRYETAAEELRGIISEKGTGIVNNTYNTYRALKRSDIRLPTKLMTGFGDFDDACTLLTSTCSLWAGWPSNGKTTVIRNIAKRIREYNKDYDPYIIHLSLDDDDRNSILNYTAMYTGIPPYMIRKMFEEKKWEGSDASHEFDSSIEETFKQHIHIFGSKECSDVASAGRIMNVMQSVYPNRKMILVVDALNNFVDFNKENQISAAEAVVWDLKRYAVRDDAHVAIVAHLKKHPGINRRPMLSDLKGTSFLEHEAQNIFLMYMETHYHKNDASMIWFKNGDYENKKPVVEINIAKDKNHEAALILPYNFDPSNLLIYPPSIDDMSRYSLILDKL